MKTTLGLFCLSLLVLTACSTASNLDKKASPGSTPETVMVTYRVKPGNEAEFQDLLNRIWKIYQENHLVFAKPHTIVRDKEAGDKTRIVEIFTWVSHEVPEHAPEAVMAIWKQENSLCEDRNGHTGIEGGEVELLAPKSPKANSN